MKSNQTRRDFIKSIALASLTCGLSCETKTSGTKKPNFVVIFLDDSGWADFTPFGKPAYPTPNVYRLAQGGCRFTQFYVPQAVCSASRASLLTGCYPGRTKVFGAHGPRSRGLDPKFATIGEVLKAEGYRTAVFGKWHVGDQPETRPPARGFDVSCGLMVSNDMWKYHPQNPDYWGQWPLQYWENGRIAIEEVAHEDQAMLTSWYTEHAVDFIRQNKNHPFFLYVPHTMPHVPLFCSDKFKGKSGMGLYADVMMEIDWSVGEIINTLRACGLEENTMVILTSDNGPWISYGNHAGRTPFRESKGTSFDGGTRSACIIKYPARIEGNTVSGTAFCTIDLFPTICGLSGAPLPGNEIDGMDVQDIIFREPGATNPHDYYAFSINKNLESVMSGDGRWKLHLPHHYYALERAGMDGAAGEYRKDHIGYALFDMKNDPWEKVNVIDGSPAIAEELKMHAQAHTDRFYNEVNKK